MKLGNRWCVPWRQGRLLLVAAAVLGAGACDFEVSNPGPVEDKFLEDRGAHWSLANGAGRILANALGWLSYTGGVAVREVIGSGNITAFGVTLLQREGRLDPALQETNAHWSRAQQARWVAEEAVRRMRDIGPEFSSYPPAAQALVWAGYANRMLGENMCVAVIDGGAAEPRRVYHERAEKAFSEAMEIARAAQRQDLEMAAHAGRASVRVGLDDWAGAVADARAVAPGFVYGAQYSEIEEDQYNRIYWAGASKPFRAASVYSTWYEKYYQNTGDRRTPWERDPQHPYGDGTSIPFYRQMKFARVDGPANLSSGREMRLILAESALRERKWDVALGILNELRGDVGLPAERADDLESTWTLLWRERAVEFWLEGRQLGDVYRRGEERLPGSGIQELTGRDRCFPIGQTEIDTNPKITSPTG